MSERKHSGADWVRSAFPKITLTPLGATVADLLGDVFSGIYHLDQKQLAKVKWDDPYVVTVLLGHQSLATFDSPYLTWLVVLSHDRMLRMDIRAKTVNMLELMFHQRKDRAGSVSERMPTMEQHLAAIRKYYPAPGDSNEL